MNTVTNSDGIDHHQVVIDPAGDAVLAPSRGVQPGELIAQGLSDSARVLGQGTLAERQYRLARALLLSYGLELVPATEEDAETAAELWARGSGLSLGDRMCLALGRRLGVDVLTSDRAWGAVAGVRQIRR